MNVVPIAGTTYCPFPVGGVFMTFANQNPSAYWPGTTWSQIAAGTFLAASGTGYDIGATGGAASVTLTAAQSGVPAHAHGLNSHTHTIGHGHGFTQPTVNGGGVTNGITGGSHSHRVDNYNNKGSATGWTLENVQKKHAYDHSTEASTHTHNLPAHTHSVSGGAVQNMSGSSGQASGNTANNTAANASSAHENRPPYIAVAMWQRTA